MIEIFRFSAEIGFYVSMYICAVMPLIYAFGGAIRKHNHCNMRTGEPLD